LEILKSRSIVQQLQTEVQQKLLEKHENQIHALEVDAKLQQTKMMAFDIIKLFRFYFLDDIVKKQHSYLKNWSMFVGKLI